MQRDTSKASENVHIKKLTPEEGEKVAKEAAQHRISEIAKMKENNDNA